MDKDDPVCTHCEKVMTLHVENFCFISRLEHLQDASTVKVEMYHPDCFVLLAGEDIYKRLEPKNHLCISCMNVKLSNPGFCKTCFSHMNRWQFSGSNPAVTNRGTPIITGTKSLCGKCHYNMTLPGVPYCQKCFDHWYKKP
jgi:hypothetical protein